ncbi:MAG: TetR/AcrR family transcriptional regulator [Negativicutes bacterium]
MRKRIIAAAIEEIYERGIKFTMHDLARRLGVSKRCLYEHFKSKDVLISCLVDCSLADITEQRRRILSDESLSCQEKIRGILCCRVTMFSPIEGRIADEIRRFMPAEWLRIEQFMNDDWKSVEQFLKVSIEKGELREVHLPIVHKMVNGAIKELVDYRFLEQNGISFSQARNYMVDALLYGMVSR